MQQCKYLKVRFFLSSLNKCVKCVLVCAVSAMSANPYAKSKQKNMMVMMNHVMQSKLKIIKSFRSHEYGKGGVLTF